MRHSILASLLLAAVLPLGAQQPVAGPPPPAKTGSGPISHAAQLVAAGDVPGAIRELEALRASGSFPAPAVALLGALYLETGSPERALATLQGLAGQLDAPPGVLYNAGRAALQLGQGQAGFNYLARAYAMEPASPAARELGFLAAREGRAVEAYQMLRPWALRMASDLEARITAASLALRLERPKEAEELLVGLAGDDPGVRLLRGQALVQRGDAEGALVQLEPLWKEHPPGLEPELRRSLAEARLLAGRAAAARELLTGHAAGVPILQVLLARAQRAAGDARAAQVTLAPLLAALPADGTTVADPRLPAAVAEEQARVLLALGQPAGAVPLLERATRWHPYRRETWEALATAYQATGRREAGAEASRRVSELAAALAAPRDRGPSGTSSPPIGPGVAEAQALLASGRGEEALARVRGELAKTPRDLAARIVEVQTLLSLQRHEEAHAAAVAALELDPQQPDLIYQLGASLLPLRRLSEAEQTLRRAVEIAPMHYAALNDLAVVLAMQDRPAEARELLLRVLAIKPDDLAARASLAEVDRLLAGKE